MAIRVQVKKCIVNVNRVLMIRGLEINDLGSTNNKIKAGKEESPSQFKWLQCLTGVLEESIWAY